MICGICPRSLLSFLPTIPEYTLQIFPPMEMVKWSPWLMGCIKLVIKVLRKRERFSRKKFEKEREKVRERKRERICQGRRTAWDRLQKFVQQNDERNTGGQKERLRTDIDKIIEKVLHCLKTTIETQVDGQWYRQNQRQ